jgi:circadian clock protein KaiB
MEKEIKLTLYVEGSELRSQQSIRQLRRIMEDNFKDRYILKIIDIHEDMQAVEEEKIMAIPTLVKEAPYPKRRLIGNFSNEEKVLHALCLEM